MQYKPRPGTAWKITLLATQWLLLSAQTIPPDVNIDLALPPPLQPRSSQYPMSYQERVLPPKEFDHDYDGQLIIKHMGELELYKQCQFAVKPGGRPLACTRAFMSEPKRCFVYMMFESDYVRAGWDYSIIFRHERGHCNGWHHDPR